MKTSYWICGRQEALSVYVLIWLYSLNTKGLVFVYEDSYGEKKRKNL